MTRPVSRNAWILSSECDMNGSSLVTPTVPLSWLSHAHSTHAHIHPTHAQVTHPHISHTHTRHATAHIPQTLGLVIAHPSDATITTSMIPHAPPLPESSSIYA